VAYPVYRKRETEAYPVRKREKPWVTLCIERKRPWLILLGRERSRGLSCTAVPQERDFP
jgi:hypothetical protein